MLTIFALIFVICFIIFNFLNVRRLLRLMAAIPGPPGIPVFGNLFSFVTKNVEEIHEAILKLSLQYGGTFKIHAFNRIIIIAVDPTDIQEILSNNIHVEKNYLYVLLRSWLGDGLLLSSRKKWATRRKIITPTFHFKILEEFVEIFNRQGSILIDKLHCCTDGNAFDIHRYIALATLDIIGESAMGIQINAQTDSNCSYVNAITEISQVITQRFIRIWLRNDFLCFIFANKLWQRQQKALKTLHNFTENIIEKRRRVLVAQKAQKTSSNDIINDVGQKKRMAFLDVLLQADINGKPLTNADIREEVDTFMFEGHDTTTSAICFTLFMISRHSDVQKKLYREIVDVFGKNVKKTAASYRILNSLKYLELVIKEALRMFPPVAIIGRLIKENSIINGKFIPANAQVIIHLLALMRNPNVFNDPNTFNPDRHLNNSNLNIFSYVPFSAGPRNCIGQKFAILEMKSIISKVVGSFELLPIGLDIHPLIDIILKSKTGFQMGLRQRKT